MLLYRPNYENQSRQNQIKMTGKHILENKIKKYFI